MRITWNVLAQLLILFCPIVSLGADTKPFSPEVTWARSIVDDFWASLIDDKPEQVGGLLSPELARYLDVSNKRGVAGYFTGLLWNRSNLAFSITSAELAPNKSEVHFKGLLTGKVLVDVGGKWLSRDFKSVVILRVIREGENGRWAIRYVRIEAGENR